MSIYVPDAKSWVILGKVQLVNGSVGRDSNYSTRARINLEEVWRSSFLTIFSNNYMVIKTIHTGKNDQQGTIKHCTGAHKSRVSKKIRLEEPENVCGLSWSSLPYMPRSSKFLRLFICYKRINSS